jgi:hypothetical protein
VFFARKKHGDEIKMDEIGWIYNTHGVGEKFTKPLVGKYERIRLLRRVWHS